MPADNHVHVFTLLISEYDVIDDRVVTAVSFEHSDVSSGRMGLTTAIIDTRIYVFEGKRRACSH